MPLHYNKFNFVLNRIIVALILIVKHIKCYKSSLEHFKSLKIWLQGGFIFNHKSAEAQCNAAAISEAMTFDTGAGHASPSCDYHYHMMPGSIAGFKDCEVVGYMIDGYPIYSQNCPNARSCYE